MRNKDYSLVVLHHEEVFATREEAINYLTGWYKPNSLDAEPVIVKYGDANNPDVILAFGTSDTKPGSFYAIDMTQAVERIDTVEEEVNGSKEELDYVAEVLDGVVKATGLILDENKIEDKVSYQPDSRDNVIGTAITIAEAIDLLSKYTQKGFEDNKFTVEDTKSVKLIYSVNPDGGMVLKARVKISTDGDSDELNFNNNIIGIKSDGIYAASNLAYDDVRHQLIFTTSGYKNGRFQDDAIVQKVDLGEHTRLVADNEDRTVKLIITENENSNITKLSADLQIADRENNILKVSDGKAYVEGLAKNIKYGETTVAAALTNHKNSISELTTSVEGAAKSAHIEGGQTDTLETVVSTLSDGGAKITGNVRLGSANSIVVRNGGLEADVSVDVDTTTNKLIVRVGNQTIEKTLPGVELFESADYNDANEELIITFKTGNTLTIPIHGIIHTWDVNNSESSPVVLTKTVVTGGVDKLSANIKLRSTDNLIGVENGKLYVSEQGINNKVSAETTRATEAENAIRTSVETLSNNVQTQFAEVSDRITTVQDNLNEESTRAREAENTIRTTAEHADEVALEAKETVNGLNSTVNELSTSLSTLETNVENLEESLTQSILTEKNRAQTAEETIINRIAHDISDVNAAIASETARATAAEQANSTRIDELAEAVGSGSAQTLADAKAYTDTKVTAEKTEREAKDIELATAIENAQRDASDDATAKATAAKEEAIAHANEEVLAEKNRAEAAEAVLTTEVNKKIESVEIVKNSQSELQYTLKVDGQDVGEINIPKDQFLKSVTYDAGNKELVFVFETTEGTVTTNVSVNDLVDTYTAGNGLTLSDNEFAVRINEDSESYLTVSEEGIKLFGIDAKFAEAASEANAYSDAQIAAETARATAAEQANANAIATNTSAIEILNGNEATEGSVKNAIKVSKDYTDEQVAGKANAADVYTKDEIDNKGFLTEHQDISNLATIASVDAVTEVAADNASAIQELSVEVNDMKFITKETDTVRMTMVKETGAETRVLSSDVKLKTLSGENANIIKSDANGLYATVTFNYDKATNKITFNDGNGNKVFELNNFGILQEAFYDSENKSIVLVVKKDDESTERITIPVADLVNEWSVQNNTNSPIILSKTAGENGDVLSANVSILDNGHNLLVNENGSLFVDSDSNSHLALFGEEATSVQGAINILKDRTDNIEQIKQDIENLEEDNNNIKVAIADYQTDLANQKERITTNENNIAQLRDSEHQLEVQVAVLTEKVNNLESRVNEAYDKATLALSKIEEMGDISSLVNRIENIENILRNLIDFGIYDTNN